MGFYKFKGLVQDVGSLDAAAEVMGADVEVLKKTLEDYNEVRKGCVVWGVVWGYIHSPVGRTRKKDPHFQCRTNDGMDGIFHLLHRFWCVDGSKNGHTVPTLMGCWQILLMVQKSG